MVEKLILIQKYDAFINYIYNPLINASNRHKVLRDSFLSTALAQYNLFHIAIKSGMPSRMYDADAGMAALRSKLRLLGSSDPKRRVLSIKQCEIAETLLSESGRILGAMIESSKKRKV